ncbi:hypothetical protein LC085_00475 [Bacillus tianshenii]|uniref:hypothetical protein n=1 Tax=Sutcliffiella tianshenii TaxID=1463404 RepID=UPI001CD2573F|nr:hypothetical protein [Bacillus tianshenii]MCA1318369.1 hypothetical protein [Bacillus tianshenii]
MYLLAQHGWGKSNKIQTGLDNGSIEGVIFSPKDEKIESLEACLSSLRTEYPNSEIILDPQFYHTTIQNTKDGRLSEYPYFNGYHGISAFSNYRNIRKFTSETLSYQENKAFNYITAPSIYMSSFSSREAQIMLSIALESLQVKIDENFQKPLLISLTIHEQAFTDKKQMEDFLDELSRIEFHGVYLTVVRNPSGYHQSFDDSKKLANILSLIYSLSEINGFNVKLGFSDFLGLLYIAAGASHIATGWSQGLRRFTLDQRVLPSSGGGRRPRPRYSSSPLLNSILLSEIFSVRDSAILKGNLNNYLSGTIYDAEINKSNPSWDDNTSLYHHWASINESANTIFNGLTDATERFDSLERAIANAEGLYTMLEAAHIQLDSKSNSAHLNIWKEAITEFRSDSSV